MAAGSYASRLNRECVRCEPAGKNTAKIRPRGIFCGPQVLERLHVRSAQGIVALIREQGQFVRVTKRISELPDRDDAPFCECAESANADFIVTLNPSDFPQNKLKTKVITPTDPLPPRGRKARPRRTRLVIRKK
jgi:hypothetical protein